MLQNNELDGFKVLRTGNANETIALLARLTQSVARIAEQQHQQQQQQRRGGEGEGGPQPETFGAWNQRLTAMRSDAGRTVRDVWGCMLAAVPGEESSCIDGVLFADLSGPARAPSGSRSPFPSWPVRAGMGTSAVHAVLAAYPTARSLHEAYEDAAREARREGRDASAAACALLANLPLPGNTGRVGANKSRDVFELLFLENSDLQTAAG